LTIIFKDKLFIYLFVARNVIKMNLFDLFINNPAEVGKL